MPTTTSTTKAQMDQVLADHFGAEAAQDLGGLLATLTDDAEHDVVGVPDGLHHGSHAIADFYQQVFALLRQEGVEPLRRYYGDDFAVDEVIYTGEADGALFGVEGRRGKVSFRMLHIIEFRDGRMSRENVWLDIETARRQLLEGPD